MGRLCAVWRLSCEGKRKAQDNPRLYLDTFLLEGVNLLHIHAAHASGRMFQTSAAWTWMSLRIKFGIRGCRSLHMSCAGMAQAHKERQAMRKTIMVLLIAVAVVLLLALEAL